MGVTEFASVSITSNKIFSWVFIADWLLTVFLTIGFIFYFNRLVGLVITLALRITLWHSKKIRIEVQSIKLSFLGGRLFFRNLIYIDHDQTVAAVQGSLTWRYWLPNVRRQEIDFTENEGAPSLENNSRLPSRFFLEIDGLEGFVYNRTVSFDNILKVLSNDKPTYNDSTKEAFDVFADSDKSFSIDSSDDSSNTQIVGPSPLLKLLPLSIKVNKGAIVAGNKTTKAVLILSYSSLEGILDLKTSENTLDRGREVLDCTIERPNISLKPNILYDREQNGGVVPTNSKNIKFTGKRWYFLRKVFHLIDSVTSKKSPNRSDESWKGLAQYLDSDSEPFHEVKGEDIEYGKYTSIISAEKLNLIYYYDIPGVVPDENLPTIDDIDIGNSGSAPKFGLDVFFSGATVYYGPWAERQRTSLHQMLLPTICRDSIAQSILKPGDSRIYTRFTLNVEFVDDFIFRIPIREFSKNEEFHLSNSDNNIIRSFAWVELKAGTTSNISVEMGLVASKSGFSNKLDLFLADLEIRSSVNHDVFLKAKEHSLSADIGYPLSWNGHTIWSFINDSKDLESYFLREHVTLISDLFTDFGTGTPVPYEMFRPFTYDFDWHIDSYKLYFNVNDANIVNNPLDFNDNCYMSLQGDILDLNVSIPLDSISKKSTSIDYVISTPSFSLVLDTPPWHSLNNFLKNNEVGRSGDFSITGSYTYYSKVGLDLVETIIISCKGDHLVLECYGFVVKYIMSIKENYFGDFTKFRTLEEYTRSLDADKKNSAEASINSDSVDEKIDAVADDKQEIHKRIENEVDVHFSFCVDDSSIILPANNYDCSTNYSLCFNTFMIDIRFTNYYMDLQCDISPIRGFYISKCDPNKLLDISTFEFATENELSICGLSIHGHRMFGLPPIEPTYFCKWDITPENFKYSGSAKALNGLISSFVKLGFGYKNLENELLIDEPELYDITDLAVIIPVISIEIKEPDLEHIVQFQLDNFSLKFIDFTNSRYTKKISLDIEEIKLIVIEKDQSKKLLDLRTAVKLTDFCNDQHYEEVKMKRNKHVSVHDGPFHRIPFFVPAEGAFDYNQSYKAVVPSLPLPDGLSPLTSNTIDSIFEDLGVGDMLYDDSSSFNDDSNNDFFQDFGDDKLPSSENFASKYWNSISGVHIKPINDYNDQDFAPSIAPDPDYETDDIVINMGKLDGYLSIDSFFILLTYSERYLTSSIEDILDNLHLAVLKKLLKRVNQKAMCANIRFISPEIDISLRETGWMEDDSFNDSDNIRLTVKAPSLALSDLSGLNDVSTRTTCAFHFQTMRLDVFNRLSSCPVLTFVLEDLEIWLDETKKQSTSLTIKNICFDISHDDTSWLVHFISHYARLIQRFSKEATRIKENVKLSQAELVYQIAIASQHYRIEHDPAVITRPAYIIRLSKRHMRANDSWKVVARLRHIFENLPPEWKAEHEESYLKHEIRSPNNAMKEVLDVFTGWRSWEFSDISNSFIFRFVFSQETENIKIPIFTEISLDSIRIGLNSPKEQNAEILLSDLECSLSINLNNREEVQVEHVNCLKFLNLEIGSIIANITPLVLKLPFEELAIVLDNSKDTIPLVSTPIKSDLTQLGITIENMDISFAFYAATLRITCRSIISEILLKEIADKVISSSILKSKFVKVELASIIQYSSSDLVFDITKLTTKEIESFTGFLHLNESNLQIANSVSIEDFLTGLTENMNLIKSDLSYFINRKLVATSTVKPKKLKMVGKFRIDSKTFKWSIGVLEPFKITGAMDDFSLDAMFGNLMVSLSLKLNSSTIDIGLQSDSKVLFQHTQKALGLMLKYSLPNKALNLDMNCSSSTNYIPDIVSRVETFKRGLDQSITFVKNLVESCKRLAKVTETISKSFDSENVKEKGGNAKPAIWLESITVSSDYIVVAAEIGSAIHSFEFQRLTVQLFDIFFDESKKPTGQVAVESTHFLIRSKDIPNEVSTLMDVNYSVKVNNDKDELTQSLQIESSYSRIVFHPSTIIKLLQLVNDIEYISSVLALGFMPSSTKPETRSSFEFFGYFSMVNILSYNCCIGFLFDSQNHNSPGLIAGCDKVFVVLERSLGKLSLMNAFLSIAKGDTSSTFYSLGNEAEGANRAFLPNMQITYATRKISNNKDIQIRVIGEELDVRFVSTSITFIEQTLKAVANIEKMKEKLIIYPTHFVTRTPSSTSPDAYIPSDITSVNCYMDFAGGMVKIYRLEDFQKPIDYIFKPSFELRTPAVKVGAEYSKTSGLKDHKLNFEVFTFSSNNILYSTCVPILVDILDSMKSMGSFNRPQEKHQGPSQSSHNFNIPKILSKVQLNLSIHIDKQELTLSCDPSAKVQAVVGIDSIHLGVNSNEDDPRHPISAMLEIKQLGASLQHTFSREVSASVGLERFLIISVLGVEPLKAFIVGNLDTVKLYLNLKQLQDVDLFRDLWVPEKLYKSNTNVQAVSTASGDSNLVFQFQKVSTTNLIPWNLNFIVSKVGLKIDLGQSLGVMSLDLERFWAISRKISDRHQDLVIGVNTIGLSSAGRLGGHLVVKNIRSRSVIKWSYNGEEYDIPLVSLSFGFDSIEAKGSFDYNVFLVAKIKKSDITVFNQVDKDKKLSDKLVATTSCESIELFITTLAAANILDIQNTLSRIRQDNKISYKEDLKTVIGEENVKKALDMFDVIATLRTELNVNFGKFLLHVYPSSLLDYQVLVVDIGGMNAAFSQKTIDEKVETSLNLIIKDIAVLLSSYKKQLPEDSINDITVDDFSDHSKNAKGGSIFVFPSLECQMQTWSTPTPSVIEYIYKSSFGGKVDIRWNLGSISFIREMWLVHAKALASRLPQKVGSDDLKNIEEKIKDVELNKRYRYIPLQTPIIEAPQLKELGDATPPLEWFGLHRQSFPGFTHQLVIVGLQKMVQEVEMQYGRVLGKA